MLRHLLALSLFVPLATLGLTACSPLKVLNGAVPAGASRITTGLPYGNDPRQKLDIYAPPDVVDPPVVVFFYGGSWNSGSRGDYKFVGDALASRGMLAVIADYRVYPQVSYPGFVEDSAQAVAWTLKHIHQYGGDEHRVFIAGHSAGAYNAAMVALDARWLAPFDANPRMLRGWIGLAGPYNFLPIEDEAVKPIFHFPGTSPDTQPINHVSANAPPALLLAGTSDTVVDPQRNSARLAEALRAAHVQVESKTYKGAGHAILVGALARPLRWTEPVLDDLTRFVQRTAPAPR
jgi:acetyl esterase/lipase